MRAKGQKRKKVDKDAGGDADEGLDGHDEEDGDDGAEEYDYAEQEGEGAIKNEFQHAPPTVTMTDGSTGLTPGWTPFFNDAVGMMAGPSKSSLHLEQDFIVQRTTLMYRYRANAPNAILDAASCSNIPSSHWHFTHDRI